MAPKRRTAASSSSAAPAKKTKVPPPSPEAKTAATDPPLPDEMSETEVAKLYAVLTKAAAHSAPTPGKESVVVYWMRNKDLRLSDNRALALASATAKRLSFPLVVLYVFSPSDYAAHDRSPRRIDFQIRQLALLSKQLSEMNVPLYTVTWEDRKKIPEELTALLHQWGASHLFGNLEYEVDELRRDAQIVRRVIASREASDVDSWRGTVDYVKDFVVVGPGEVLTKQGKPYSVFSPWYKNWSATIASNPGEYLEDAGTLEPNEHSARKHSILESLFDHQVPTAIAGWTLSAEDQETMNHLWPVGVADQVMHRFLKTKLRDQAFQHPPLHPGAEEVELKHSKIGMYGTGRNRVDLDGTSHISPYLAAGMISPRECLRATMELTKGKLQTDKDGGGVGVWVSEVAWRDFYQHVLVAWPRICMGRQFNLKFDDVVWETNAEHLQAWKDGKTGFPIVDAAMRALKKQGYLHNRNRMIVAMFLTKDLMLDWRLGEKWFMQNLIDGDLGSNNGGWQWSASTGTDPQPYFRVFNPTSQSEKSDVSGDYIRFWCPELAHLKGKLLHDPGSKFSSSELKKMGYVSPIVDHAKARLRAIARYKNPGDDDDE